jgi:hypothetical protein
LRVHIATPAGGQADTWCTAVLVAPDVLLTAHHCVPGRFGARAIAAELHLFPIGAARPEAFAVEIAPLESSPHLDYALLRVSGRPGDRFGWVHLAPRSAQQGEALAVVHYPAPGAALLTRRNCRVHRVSATDFLHTCDTSPGSSGAPLFLLSGELIGMHYAGSRAGNYGKQVAALVAGGALLAHLSGTTHPRAPAGEPEGETLATGGDRVVARQMREALAAFDARTGPGGGEATPAVDKRNRGGEPMIKWER